MNSQITKSKCTTDGTSIQIINKLWARVIPAICLSRTDRQPWHLHGIPSWTTGRQGLYFEPLAAWHTDLYMVDTQMICELFYHWNSSQDNSNTKAFAVFEECVWVDKQSPEFTKGYIIIFV